MTSVMTTAETYEKWLGIPASQHPPHHYALLGLPPLSANEQTIFQAYQQRAMLVGQHLGGPQADAARRLLGELAAAQACLLNVDARAVYDRWLSERLSVSVDKTKTAVAAAAGHARPAPRSKVEPPVAAVPRADGVTPPPYSNFHESNEPSTALPWLVGGVCAGLLAVAVLGVALFGFQRAPRSNVANDNSTATKQGEKNLRDIRNASVQHRTAQRDRDTPLVAKLRDDDVLGQRIAPLTTKPEQLTPDSSVVGPPDATDADGVVVIDADDGSPTTDDAAEVAPKPETDSSSPKPTLPTSTTPAPTGASTLAKLPRSFALPSRTSSGAQGLLAQFPVKNAEKVNLKLNMIGVAGGDRFKLQAAAAGLAEGERIWPVQYAAADGTKRDVGEYALVGDELSFRWADSAQAGDELLANAALKVSLDDAVVEINQRSPDATAPLKLAVDSGAISTSTKIEARPPDAKLYFALDRQDEGFPAHTLQPEEPAPAGTNVDVIFGEATDPYRLAMRVSLVENGVGGVRIEARPMLQAADEGQKWDYFRPKAVLQTLAQFKQQEALFDAQLAQVQQRLGRNPVQLQQAMELLNRQAAAVQTRVLTLEKLHALCEELNDHGALNYRVFAKFGERDVDLLDSSLGITVPVGDAPAKTSAAEDPSGIVGPPTAEPKDAPPAPDTDAEE